MIDYNVIIPTYNQTDLTLTCVDSLAEMTEVYRTRLIWVDNGSTYEHTADVMDRIYDRHRLDAGCYGFRENMGFPKAVNLGIAMSTAPYVVLLNNDVVLQSGVFDTMRKALDDTGAYLAGPVSTSGWQRRTRLDAMGIGQTGYHILKHNQHLAFFCTMITRQCIQEIGYLSEAMGMGFGEDDDYNERVHRAGKSRVLCLDAFVEHKHRSTWKSMYTDDEILEHQKQSMDVLEKKYGEKVW